MSALIKRLSLVFVIVLIGCSEGGKEIKEISNVIETYANCENVELNISSFGITLSKDSPNSVGARYEFLVGDCKENNMDSIAMVLLDEFKKKNLCKNALIIIDFKEDKQMSFSNCSLLDN